jgi:hypothetical protein
MGHHISGLIAKHPILERFARQYSIGQPTIIGLGFGFLPLDDENLDEVVGLHFGSALGGMCYLSPAFLDLLVQFSRHGDLLYIETDYNGGSGTQGAVAVQQGQVTFGPENRAAGVINEALAKLGVTAGSARDAFEAVGLHNYRRNEYFRPDREED